MRTWNHWLVLCLYDICLNKHLTVHYQIDFLNYKHTLYMMLKHFMGPFIIFEMRPWIRIHIHCFTCDVITHPCPNFSSRLTHWGRVTHICVDNLTILGSDNGLSPGRRQAIIWTNAGILLIGPLETNFSEILIKIHAFSFKKLHLKMSSMKWRLFVSASMC